MDFRPVYIDPTFNNGTFNVTTVSFPDVVLEGSQTAHTLSPLCLVRVRNANHSHRGSMQTLSCCIEHFKEFDLLSANY